MFWLNPATHGLFGPISAQRSKHLGSSTASAAHGAASWCSLGGVPKNEGNGFIHKLWPFWWGGSTIYGHPNGIYPQFMVIWKKFDQWTSMNILDLLVGSVWDCGTCIFPVHGHSILENDNEAILGGTDLQQTHAQSMFMLISISA